MLGLLEDARRIARPGFRTPGDVIWLLGPLGAELGGSEYVKVCHGRIAGEPPDARLDLHRRLLPLLVALVGEGRIRSAHDAAEGGIAVALAECLWGDPERMLGADVNLRVAADEDAPAAALLFGETQGRVIVTTDKDGGEALVARAREAAVPCAAIGTVRPLEDGLRIAGAGATLHLPTEAAAEAYFGAIPKVMARKARTGEAA
jgi:phosphoribosylformylglycinamidine synthase